MTTAKMKFLLGYNLKIVIPCGQWTFAGESVPGVFWLGGTSFHLRSRENPV